MQRRRGSPVSAVAYVARLPAGACYTVLPVLSTVHRPRARVLTAYYTWYYTPTLSRDGNAGEMNYRFVPNSFTSSESSPLALRVKSARLARHAALSASRLVPLVR